MLRDCATCGASEGSLPGIPIHNACSKCKVTFYCSTKCQKQHWKKGGHKLQCAALVGEVTTPKAGGVELKTATPTAAPSPPAATSEKLCACCMDPLPATGSDILQMPCAHHCHGVCLRKLDSLGVKEPCLLCCSKELVPGPAQVHEKALRRFIVLHYRYNQGEDKPWRKIATADDRREMGEVLRLLRDAATQGNHADAQYSLGFMHATGEGVTRNDALAVKWLRKSACQGNARAQNNLGVLHRLGRGVPQSETTALEWFRKSAAQGLAHAQFSLGTSFLDGVEVPQNVAEAARYFLQAAEQGHAMAQYNLGVCHTHGRGVAQDEAAAAAWYRKAAEQGNVRAQYDLGVLYANVSNFVSQSVSQRANRSIDVSLASCISHSTFFSFESIDPGGGRRAEPLRVHSLAPKS